MRPLGALVLLNATCIRWKTGNLIMFMARQYGDILRSYGRGIVINY